MTIEEFREFGWKAGMKFIAKGGASEIIDAVFFNHGTLVGENVYVPEEIISVRNPDGTVAWGLK